MLYANADPLELVIGHERGKAIIAAINHLKPKEREAIIDLFANGVSMKSVGTGRGLSHGTLWARKQRALRKLRTELKDWF